MQEVPLRAIMDRLDGLDGGSAALTLPASDDVSHLYGSETVPNPVPPQRWTLCFLGALVFLTYAGFAFTLLFGGGL